MRQSRTSGSVGARGEQSPRATRPAARIEETLPTFDDHSFVCRTAQGYSDNGVELIATASRSWAR
jgi:hypothetical protein